MRKILFAAVILLLLFIAPGGAHASTQDFTIPSFSADYYLTRDQNKVSELHVVEKIIAEFPNYDQNHGILRAIPQDYQGHPLELRIQKISGQSGQALPYSTYEENGNLVLKIGDADAYVHGLQTYVIDYTMRGVALNLADHEEFYWDINGDQWEQTFENVQARIHVPADFAANLQEKTACYAGGANSQDTSNCVVGVTNEGDGKVISFTTRRPLSANQTMTTVLGFNKGTFVAYTPSPWQVQQWVWMTVVFVVPPVLALGFMLYMWRRVGRDARGKGVIVPQYLPPKELGVIASGLLLKERFESKTASATIIDLAVRHFIKIYELQKESLFKGVDYELELIRKPEKLRSEELEVLNMLFGANPAVGAKVKLSSLKAKLSTKVLKMGKSVAENLTKDGYFRTTPNKAKLPYIIGGSIGIAVGVSLVGISPFLGVGFIAAGLIVLIGSQFMPARTLHGVEMRDYLLGLRDYMKLAEEERLRVLQSPRGDLTEKIDVGNNKQLVKLYEKLLPYAMLFNLEKDWAAQMAGLYEEAPDWYSGSSTFNAVWFASSIGSFSSNAATTFAPPSSSSSSGFGGGAGGGGGGGGGGGW